VPIALIILLFVLIAIALRKSINMIVPIGIIMFIGSMATLLFHQITPSRALTAIDPNVMFYLLGVFLICQAAETSGYLEQITDRLFIYSHTGKHALFIIVFVLGLSAALFMNDTVAIVGTPIILQLCKSHKKLIEPLLLALAFSVTIGSTMSPIGNPQNLLIAIKSNMASPFFTFIKTLAIPTIMNLIIVYFFIYVLYRNILNETIEKPIPIIISNDRNTTLVKLSLVSMLVLIAIKILTDFIQSSFHINFSYIALLSAVPILFSNQRWMLIKKLDWSILLFFASTFVLMQSVWDSGFFQRNIQYLNIPLTHLSVILVLSIILSQFISNVPLVALYLPLLIHHNLPESHLLALAVGSSIAGNLSILGAASNVIIVQNAEKHGNKGFSFFKFIKFGLLLTSMNAFIYACFI